MAATLNAQLQGAMEQLSGNLGPSAAYRPSAAPAYAAPLPRFAGPGNAASRLTDSVYGDPGNNLQQLFTVPSGASIAGPAPTKQRGGNVNGPDAKPKKSYWWIFGVVILALVLIGVIIVVVTRMQAKKQQAKDLLEMQRIEAEKAAALTEAAAAEADAVSQQRAQQQQAAAAQQARAAAAEADFAAAQVASVRQAQAQAAASRAARAAAAAQRAPTIVVTTSVPSDSKLKTSPRVEQVPDDEEATAVATAVSNPVSTAAVVAAAAPETLADVNGRIKEGIDNLSQGIASAVATSSK